MLQKRPRIDRTFYGGRVEVGGIEGGFPPQSPSKNLRRCEAESYAVDSGFEAAGFCA